MERTAADIIEALRRSHPTRAFVISRFPDEGFLWDGFGPDPFENGFFPYVVKVACVTVHDGRVLEGVAYLGGSYFRLDEPIGDAGGYLPQLLDEAVADLTQRLLEYTR